MMFRPSHGAVLFFLLFANLSIWLLPVSTGQKVIVRLFFIMAFLCTLVVVFERPKK